MRRLIVPLILVGLLLAGSTAGEAWGLRAHSWINRVAVRTLPDDGPAFLKAHEEWIAYLAIIPDTWRRPSEPFLKMLEDPNHGWFKEQFAFMTTIPRSRYEFVLALYDEHRRLEAAGDPAATLTNVRWTGTMPYAAVEGYERMLAGMRRYRAMHGKGEDTTFVEREIAFYMGWTGHYTGDGAQPLHDTIHHDGWQGANPKGYTTNPRIHGLFESQFVELMELEGRHFESRVPPARVLADPFTAILEHLDEAGGYTEQVYQLEQRGAFADASNADARALVIQQAARGSALLRDLAHTAWVRSGEPPVNDPAGNPIVPAHPRYNPATGTAPAPTSEAAPTSRVRPGATWAPMVFADPVVGKNFHLFDAITRMSAVRERLERAPGLAAIRQARIAKLEKAEASCGMDAQCITGAFKWSSGEIAEAGRALSEVAAGDDILQAFVEDDLRTSGLFHVHRASAGPALLVKAWEDAAAGLNRIVDVYGLGVPPFYPKIDSVSYDAASESYRRIVDAIASVLHETRDDLTLFYEPTLGFAVRLLEVNRRDEAGRFEPLHLGENAAGYRRVPSIDWARYAYAAIVVPGSGNESPDVALSPFARVRLELAAARYRTGRAPFIIVSGGYVHPNQTRFAEAFEMKRALVADLGVPPEAVLIDPHARHTTTNLRNAARLALRYGFPGDKPLLITTDRWQSEYISSDVFFKRCASELGYQPGRVGTRLSRFDLEFHPSEESLHADARDPLDP